MFLTPENFYVDREGKLCNKVPGYSFVLFSSPNCAFCKDVIPAFTKLSQMIQGCTFSTMNVEQQRQKIRDIAQQSDSPINYVPLLILYGNGRPIAQYFPDEQNPQSNLEKMKQFLVHQTSNKKQGQGQAQSSTDTGPPVPAYSMGIPGNSQRRVCYLNFDSAYKK